MMTEEEKRLYLRRLRFPDDLERAFRADYARRSVMHVRIALLLGLFLVVILASLFSTHAAYDPTLRPVLGYRLGVLLPLTLGMLIVTFLPAAFARLMQPGLCLTVLAYGGHVLFYRALYPSSGYTMQAADWQLLEAACLHALSLIILITHSLTRLRFACSVAVTWLMIGGYFAVRVFADGSGNNPVQHGVLIDLLEVNLIGMAMGYLIERSIRENFLLTREVEAEREKSERLLLNILPLPIAERLKRRPDALADSYAEVTVLFADIVDFTPLSARLSAERVVGLLNEVFSTFDAIAERHGLEKIKTIGDSYMVVGGLPQPREDHVEAVAEMALDLMAAMERFRDENGRPITLRVGINTGPVVAGVIGTKRFIYDLWGDTVNMASRMESHGTPGTIQVTAAVYERLRGRYAFSAPREVAVKGRGRMAAYLLRGRRGGGKAQEVLRAAFPGEP